ncbi:MAG: hypothetical protein V8T86_15165 [Victivallis sp.]
MVTNIREQPVPVWLDYDKLTRDILSFLWDRGHRRIGYITSPVRMYGRGGYETVGVMKTFFGERGAEFEPGWVFEGEDSIESGISGAERIMKDGGVTAIFTGNDQMAFGVYRWACPERRKDSGRIARGRLRRCAASGDDHSAADHGPLSGGGDRQAHGRAAGDETEPETADPGPDDARDAARDPRLRRRPGARDA